MPDCSAAGCHPSAMHAQVFPEDVVQMMPKGMLCLCTDFLCIEVAPYQGE